MDRQLKVVHAKYDSSLYINIFDLQCSAIHNAGPGQLHVLDENIVFIYPILDRCGFSLIREIGQILYNGTGRLLKTKRVSHCLL